MFYFFFYYPLGLDVRTRGTLWVTWGLVGASFLGFAVAMLVPQWLWTHYSNLVYVPAAPTIPSLIANAFMHGDWLHLTSNMLALVVFGPALEARLGAWRFALLFLFAHVAGNLVQGAVALLFLPATAEYGVLGASGAIAGLMGVVLVRLHFARLRVGYWAFLPLQAYVQAGTRTLPVMVAILLWFLMQIGLAVAQSQGGETGIAVGSHLGGLGAGAAMGILLGLRRDAAAERHLERGRRYLSQAQWYAAQGEFLDYLHYCPEDPEGHLELARTYRLTTRSTDADVHYRLACEHFAQMGRMDRVEEIHGEAARTNVNFALAPSLQLQLGKLFERTFKRDLAESLYLTYARIYPTHEGVSFALFRAARLAHERRDHEGARALYVQLLLAHAATVEADFARLALQELNGSSSSERTPQADAA